MGEFLVELDGCLYDNPEDVVEEFNKLRAERDALKAACDKYSESEVLADVYRLTAERDALRDLLHDVESAFVPMTRYQEILSEKMRATIDAARGE